MTELTDEIAATFMNLRKNASEECVNALASVLADLKDCELGENAPRLGDIAPDISSETIDGHIIKLTDMVKTGPVIVQFVAGSWCPLCMVQVKALIRLSHSIKEKGARILFVSPQNSSALQDFMTQRQSFIPVIYDENQDIAKAYGVDLSIPLPHPDLATIFNIAPEDIDEDGFVGLPLPATFVINRNMKITWSFIDSDFSKRAEPDDIMRAV